MTGEFCIAVHALVLLHHKGAILSSEAIAANVCTNPARIRKVMAKLKRADLVVTREGSEGGYASQGDPAKITLRQVCNAVEARMVSSGWRSGGGDCECMIASGMGQVMDGLYQRLDDCCMRELETMTLRDVEKSLFARKGKGTTEP